jgi:hypothetical protein
VNGTCTFSAVIGAESLPRRPRPSNAPSTRIPLVVRGTSHKVDISPSAATGRVDQTYVSAKCADVEKVFLPLIRTPSPSAVAVLCEAQNWLREPGSENASVVRCLPAAIALRTSSGPCASITAVAE